MRKATMSFKQWRRALVDRMAATSSETVVEKSISFQEKDAFDIFKDLDRFEKKSRQTKILVR
jgi:hypothetical protein